MTVTRKMTSYRVRGAASDGAGQGLSGGESTRGKQGVS
jgi:hypothetical protein